METRAPFEGEVLSLLRQLSAKREKLDAQYKREIAELDRQIEAVQITARLVKDSGEGSLEDIHRPNIVVPSTFRGMSVRQACVEIAKLNGGILKIGDATKALISGGVIRKKKNAWGATYTACARSKDFEKGSEPATFKLVSGEIRNDQQNLLTQPRPM
jgi:hypothetical protein